MSATRFSSFELTVQERDALEAAHDYGKEQYNLYRKRGLSKPAALQATLAWAVNVKEQAARRCEHETGCTRDGRMI